MNQTDLVQPVVLFDAVGTLIFPKPQVDLAYAEIGRRHGSDLTPVQIKDRFHAAYQREFVFEPSNSECNESHEVEKWRRVVADVFQSTFSDKLFTDLWHHFAQPSSWSTFHDVHELIDQLHKLEIIVGIASNFDGRLQAITKQLIPQIPDKLIFCSTQIGFAKPNPKFYEILRKRLEEKLGLIDPLMIGDQPQLDFEAALLSGFKAILKQGDQLPNLQMINDHLCRKT